MVIKRGDIYYADLSPVVGAEEGGTRLVVVISNDIIRRNQIHRSDIMPDLNDFYAFKMTTSGGGSSGVKSNNSGGGMGCSTVLVVLAVVGWVLWIVGKFFG